MKTCLDNVNYLIDTEGVLENMKFSEGGEIN